MSSRKPLLPLLFLFLACGKPPVPVRLASPSASPAANPHGMEASLPGGSDPHAMLDKQATYEGVVRLKGELAARRDGYLFVSLKLPGVGFPVYSAKLSLAAREGEAEGGVERLVSFRLDESHKLGFLTDDPHVIEVLLDVDGYIETKEDILARGSVPAEQDQTGIEVVLEPAGS